MYGFLEELFDVDIDAFDEDDYDLKFFVWGRKIKENVEYLEENNCSKENIRKYLQNCADLREKFLDPFDLTEVEEYWTIEILGIWEEYQVIDPISEKFK